ncbi:MAG: hypothetical protein ABFS39_00020 [Pseudomonadota bacterium]
MSHEGFIEVADEAIDILKKLTGNYPHLVSPHVKAAIDNWEKHVYSRIDAEQAAADLERAEEEALSRLAAELIETHQMEDVLELLSEKFSITVDYQRLIGLIGKDSYVHALRREVSVLEANAISLEQMAQLWNGMGKPVLGGGRWTASKISLITKPPEESFHG